MRKRAVQYSAGNTGKNPPKYSNTLCRVVDPSKKVPDLNCEVQDLLLEVVDLKQDPAGSPTI